MDIGWNKPFIIVKILRYNKLCCNEKSGLLTLLKSVKKNKFSPALVNSQILERPTPVLVRRRGLVSGPADPLVIFFLIHKDFYK